jgi:hypothetical protein
MRKELLIFALKAIILVFLVTMALWFLGNNIPLFDSHLHSGARW